jgi:predicted  nucleic acid-binding Zn-ribbon protein
LLSSAVRFSCKGEGQGLERVEADLKTILELLRSSEHLSVMLIDVRRNVTLARAKADGRHDIEELEAAIAALTARHAARVEAIQKSQLSSDDKDRLIEELETELSAAISKLVTG